MLYILSKTLEKHRVKPYDDILIDMQGLYQGFTSFPILTVRTSIEFFFRVKIAEIDGPYGQLPAPVGSNYSVYCA